MQKSRSALVASNVEIRVDASAHRGDQRNHYIGGENLNPDKMNPFAERMTARFDPSDPEIGLKKPRS